MRREQTGTWLEHDIRELTITRVLATQAKGRPDDLFIRDLDSRREYTYRDALRESLGLAAGFDSLAIGNGSHVAVMMGTRPDNVWVQFALAHLGAVGALVNTAARGDLLHHYLQLAEATHVVVDDIHAGRVLEVSGELPLLRHVVIVSTGEGVDLPVDGNTPELHRLDELLVSPDQAMTLPQGPRFTDPALILFTSGTTGPSKGVLYTQARSLLYALDTAVSFGVSSSDRLFCWMPLFHLSGLQSCVFTALVCGGSVAMTAHFSLTRIMEQVRDSESTILMLPGASINMLWGRTPVPEDRDHRVRLCSTVPIPAFSAEFEKRFGFKLCCAYGLTDCGMPTAYGPTDLETKRGSAGRARDGWSVRVADDDDFDMATGEVGNILIRCERPWGNSSGYYNNPQATVEAWRNGWFHTGDRGYLDDDGYLWVVGRTKDSIRRRGENISAFEVESVLLKHGAIAEAAAFPLPSELGEEEVAVAVILKEGAVLREAELVEFCTEQMPAYMVPRYIMTVEDLPRTLSQKVQKFKLISQAKALGDGVWDRERTD